MIRIIEGLPPGVFGIQATATGTQQELDEVMSAFESTVASSYEVDLFVEFGADFQSAAVMEETRFHNRLSARGRTRRFAFVGPEEWRETFDEFVRFVGCDARMFPPRERDAALAWLLQPTDSKSPEDKI